jgi:hypothetical protein
MLTDSIIGRPDGVGRRKKVVGGAEVEKDAG